MRALVVDDEDGVREGMLLFLERRGFEAFSCSTAEDALAFLGRESVDLIFTDVNMPHMNGLDFLRRIRMSIGTPVIVMSGNPDISIQQVLDLGGNAFVLKPHDYATLDRAIEAVFNALPAKAKIE